MPGLDRKGPQGDGPKTGRGLGKCNPDKKNQDENSGNAEYGQGLGRRTGRGQRAGRGRGRGMGNN